MKNFPFKRSNDHLVPPIGLDEPITLTGYDEYNVVPYECIVEARDGRRFLARALECLLLELADGSRTAYDIARKAAAAYADGLWKHGLAEAVQKGEISKEEAKKALEELPQRAFIGLAILRALGLVI